MKMHKNCVRAFVKSNLGDDLFLYVLCSRYTKEKFIVCGFHEFQKSISDIRNLRYVSIDQPVTKWAFRILNFIPILFNQVCKKIKGKTLLRKIRCFDVVSALCENNILISGSLFIENEQEKNIYYKNEEKYYARHPYVLGCNFGPYYTMEYLDRHRKLFEKAKQVSFRDSYSKNLFCWSQITWYPDILFSYPKEKCERPDMENYILISVLDSGKDLSDTSMSAEKYTDFMIKLVNRLTAASEKVVLMGFCKEQGDHIVCNKICEGVMEKQRVLVLNYPEIHYNQAVGYIANAKYVVATRYHAMILGWLYEKNVYPIVYNEKMKHVIEDISDKIVYSDINDLNDGTIEKIIQSIKEEKFTLHDQVRYAIEKSEMHFEKLDELFGRTLKGRKNQNEI